MKELSIKEIEDEKIIKHLITLFKHEYGENSNARFAGIKVKDIIAWLEKQGEQETLCDKCRKEHPSHFCQDITELGRCAVEHEQNHIDKVKPKFHEGDWIINSQGTLRHIINVDEGGYQTDGGWLNHYTYEKTFHLWTIKDAKAGDILYAKICDEEWLYLYSSLIDDTDFLGLLEKSWINNYCCLRKNDSWFSHVEQEAYPVNEYSIISPATKEQRDTLMKAMADAGYTFDFEKKELKKIEQVYDVGTDTQKTAWSEEDEKQARQIERIVHNDGCTQKLQKQIADWFKSLKDRVQQQPKQEWSEEDEKTIHLACEFIRHHSNRNDSINGIDCPILIERLKFLKPQNIWKPDSSMLICLEYAIKHINKDGDKRILSKLLEQLKQL